MHVSRKTLTTGYNPLYMEIHDHSFNIRISINDMTSNKRPSV